MIDRTVGGRYALGGALGAGGMGRVYKARHLQLGKAFALKLIAPAYALDAEARARFLEEAQLASEIAHPNIVSVVDFGEDATHGAYMVMELVEGGPLVGKGPLSIRRACDVLGQIADALDHIHRRGIVHGDVKADNILLASESAGPRRRHTARLLDFGLARRPGATASEDAVNGSPHYLAPERAAGCPPTVAADVYALGILAFQLLTGTPPFDGEPIEILMAHVHAPMPSVSERRGEPLDPALEQLVRRATAKHPSLRHPSAAAFRYELNTVMDMLDLGRRRGARGTPALSSRAREAAVVAAFDHSPVAQALLGASGEVLVANDAFARLTGAALPVPELAYILAKVQAAAEPCEVRAQLLRPDGDPLAITLWLAPLPGGEVHAMIMAA